MTTKGLTITPMDPYTEFYGSARNAEAFVLAYEQRDTEGMTFDRLHDEFGFGHATHSGIPVNAEMAYRIGAAYACRRVISEDIAKLARRVVRIRRHPITGRARSEILLDHPVHRLLTEQPNDWMTPFEFWEYMVGVATFHRGSYALVQRDAHGVVTELLPLLPGSCAPHYDDYWNVTYHATGYGDTLILQPHQVLRINGPMADPWEGHSTIALAREAIALASQIEASQAKFHANDMRPSGILSSAEKIEPQQRDAIRAAWKSAYGTGGQGGVAVLDKSFDFKPITLEGAKSEVVDNRKFQISDICRFFRVFPTAIGHNDGSQSYASVESFRTAHATNCLQPWAVRVEEAASLALLTPEERAAGLAIDLDMDEILRGTPSERAKFYETATKTYMTPNEARVREGLDPITDDPDMDRVQLQRNNTRAFSSDATVPSRLPAPGTSPISEVIS